MTPERIARCELCGEPMPHGEEMFKYHGYSGPCPEPPQRALPTDERRPSAVTPIPAALREARTEIMVKYACWFADVVDGEQVVSAAMAAALRWVVDLLEEGPLYINGNSGHIFGAIAALEKEARDAP